MTQLVGGSIQERLNTQLLESARAARNTIVDVETQQIATLRLMAFTEGIDEIIVNRDVEELAAVLQPIVINEGVDEVVVFDRTGEPIYGLQRRSEFLGVEYDNEIPADIYNWSGIERVINGEVDPLGDKFIDISGEAPDTVFFVSAPVLDEDENIVGGISIGIRASSLVIRVREQALSSVTLYDSSGLVLDTTFRTLEDNSLQLNTSRITELLSITQQGDSPVEERELGNRPYQVLYAPFQMRDQQIGLIAVALPRDFVADRIGSSRDTLVYLFSGLFVVVAMIGIIVSRTIVNPVQQLVDTTRAIREGDMSRRVKLTIPDELGELGSSFDHMTDQLVASNEQINQLYVAQLEETSRRDAILSSIRDSVVVLNMKGDIILRNDAAINLFDETRHDLATHQKLLNLCAYPTELFNPRTVEIGELTFSVLATTVNMPSGDRLGYVIVLRDITELVEAQRTKDDMILQLSHELRTPLTSAKGSLNMIEVLDKNRLSQQGISFLDATTRSLETLVRMVNQVIDVNSLLANQFGITPENVNMAFLVNNVVNEYRKTIDQRNLRVSVLIHNPDIWIEADRVRITQVISEILLNAVHYNKENGWIEITAEVHFRTAVISIANSGVGIQADEQELIFERTYRGHSVKSITTDARGLGLGLYISRQIVEVHQGTIEVNSVPDEVTIFTVKLPVRQKHDRTTR